MPVTARLSKNFYDRFGDDVANELVEWFNSVDATYRANLRELNEMNFARFDAKMEQRLGKLEAQIDARFVQIGAGFEALRKDVDGRFDRFETKMTVRMFTFFTGQTLALAGFLYAILHGR